MHPYVTLARSLGFAEAVLLEPITLECKPELRAYCNPKQCPNHGQNWVCPPGCGTLEACREKTRAFEKGLLVQSVTHLDPPTEPETYAALSRAHNLRLQELAQAMRQEGTTLMPLSTGGCVLCDKCSYPAPCVHPDTKMESLSAFGIDAGALCQTANLPYAFRPDTLYLTALILFREEP